MSLLSLEVRNFRNYIHQLISLSPKVNIFFGENAQGKTNLLEAVYYCSLGRSFRSRRDEELIRHGESHFFIRGAFIHEEQDYLVEIGVDGKTFKGKINGEQVKRRLDLFGTIQVVLFSPDDLQLVKGGPQNRRDYIDLYLSQAYPRYRYAFLQYQRILQQRNQLLKQIRERTSPLDLLEEWNENLLVKGSALIRQRLEALKTIERVTEDCHLKISRDRERITLSYHGLNGQTRSTDDDVESIYRRQLALRQSEEIARGISLVGPHRDDIILTLGEERELKIYGSQGQQRTASLALKMAMVEFLTDVCHTRPILLLDDVMSEFDDQRKQALLKMLTGTTQTIITSADIGSRNMFGSDVQLFHVEAGAVDSI